MAVNAGSGVTARVAIATQRHSVSSDADSMLRTYLSRQLAQFAEGGVLPDYVLIEDGDWSIHPALREAAVANKLHTD